MSDQVVLITGSGRGIGAAVARLAAERGYADCVNYLTNAERAERVVSAIRVYHYHHFEEEFVYVISGRGIAEIGDEKHEVGPGDVMLFTAPSVGHHLSNPFETDLVYLMGGESHAVEIGEYPRLRKRAIFEKGKDAYIVDLDATRPFRT